MHFLKLFLFQDVDVFKGNKTSLIQRVIRRFQTFHGILRASDFKIVNHQGFIQRCRGVQQKPMEAMKACPSQVPESPLYNTLLADKSKWSESHQY